MKSVNNTEQKAYFMQPSYIMLFYSVLLTSNITKVFHLILAPMVIELYDHEMTRTTGE